MDKWALWIQSISTVLLVLVTWKYVRHTQTLVNETRKLAEEGSNSFINIEKFDFIPHRTPCSMLLSNSGPGHALNIKVEVELKSLKKAIEQEQDITEIVVVSGPKVLTIGANGKYEVTDPNYSIGEKNEIYISYITQTGKKYKYKWIKESGGDVEFIGLVAE